MATRLDPLVQACLSGNVDRVCAIVDQTPSESHLYESYVGIHAAVVALMEQSDPAGPFRRLRRALSRPETEPQILMLLVRYASLLAVRLGQIQEARRLILIGAEVPPEKAPAELRAAVILCDAALHEARADFERAAEVCTAALDLNLSAPGRFGDCVRSHRAYYAILCHDFATAEADIKAIDLPEDHRRNLREPVLALRVRLCGESGRAEQGLAILDAAPKEDAGIGRARYVTLCVRLLNQLGRLDEAAIMLDQAENEMATLSVPVAHGLRAEQALAQGDLEAARVLARDGIAAAKSDHPADVVVAIRTLASAELSDRRTIKVRQILARIDRDESKMPTQMHWARLYLLENNPDQAVEHFQRVAALGPAYVAQSCRYARELSGHDLARLQARSVVAGGQWVGPVAAPVGADDRRSEPRLVGNSTSMRAIRSRIRSYASLSTPVLITGQTGTGKDVVARLLHQHSGRTGEFIPVNCGALSDTLIESELFGHVKGAFTGAAHDHEGLFVAAGRGTIFLDEIHAMSPRLQAALLRVLENGEVRPVGSSRFQRTWARVIAATNEPIDQLLQRKQLRSDLYYRLAKLRVDIPPLRQRPEDVEPLVRHCLREMFGHLDLVVADDLVEAMRRDPWPGNVRELKNDIERIVLAAGESRILTAAMFPGRRQTAVGGASEWRGDDAGQAAVRLPPVAHRRTDVRRRRLRDMFEQYDRLSRAEVIELLGCSPNTATRDLRVLEQEGKIRRVHTSAHLRTSYFVKNGER